MDAAVSAPLQGARQQKGCAYLRHPVPPRRIDEQGPPLWGPFCGDWAGSRALALHAAASARGRRWMRQRAHGARSVRLRVRRGGRVRDNPGHRAGHHREEVAIGHRCAPSVAMHLWLSCVCRSFWHAARSAGARAAPGTHGDRAEVAVAARPAAVGRDPGDYLSERAAQPAGCGHRAALPYSWGSSSNPVVPTGTVVDQGRYRINPVPALGRCGAP